MNKRRPELVEFGKNVRTLRTARGISQEKLGDLAEIDRTYKWAGVTRQLVAIHPLSMTEVESVTLSSWAAILASSFGGFKIGTQIKPKPQMMAFFLSELISLEFARRYPEVWQPDQSASDKDMVYVPDLGYSVENKASSNPTQVFGNRSYAQPSGKTGKKGKSGYYLAINFQKFSTTATPSGVVRIKFGWLDHNDWIPQSAATGQQARIAIQARRSKLLQIFP